MWCTALGRGEVKEGCAGCREVGLVVGCGASLRGRGAGCAGYRVCRLRWFTMVAIGMHLGQEEEECRPPPEAGAGMWDVGCGAPWGAGCRLECRLNVWEAGPGPIQVQWRCWSVYLEQEECKGLREAAPRRPWSERSTQPRRSGQIEEGWPRPPRRRLRLAPRCWVRHRPRGSLESAPPQRPAVPTAVAVLRDAGETCTSAS